MKTLRIGFVPDVSPEAGLGHVMRCMAISQGLLETHGALPVVIGDHGVGADLFKKAGIDFIYCNGTVDELRRVVVNNNIDLVVIDSYVPGKVFYSQLRRAIPTTPVLVIDDDFEKLNFEVHGYISFNPGTDFSRYPAKLKQFSVLGPQYYPVRKEVTDVGPPDVKGGRVPCKLLVTMGGSDPDSQTLRIVRLLSQLPGNQEITVVVGLANEDDAAIRMIACKDERIRVIYDPPQFAELLGETDLAICGGGVTMAELLALEKPVVALALAENCCPFAQAAHAEHVGVFLGRFDRISDDDIVSCLSHLISNETEYAQLRENQGRLVDGYGRQRLANALYQIASWFHSDDFKEELVKEEYEEAACAVEEHEKLKWGSKRGMYYRFRLASEQVDWNAVVSWCDVGCGTGAMLRSVRSRGHNLRRFVGIDLSPSLLRYATENVPEGVATDFVEGSFLAHLPEEPYDLVTCFGVLQKCGVNLFKAVARLAEMTAPEGRLVFTTKNLDWQRFQERGFEPEEGHHWFYLDDIELACELAGIELKQMLGFIPSEERQTEPEEAHSVMVVCQKEKTCA